MNIDDVVYLCLLFFSIVFGYYYRRFNDGAQKKMVGTSVGLLIIFIVSGRHIVHPLLTFLVNSGIILLINKKQCHLVSFAFSFTYLLLFRSTIYFGIPYPPAHTNLVQMMLTLKLVGLAFEVNSSYNSRKKDRDAVKIVKEESQDEGGQIDPDFMEILHYSFNYIGVLTGPYYRYRTFKDFFDLPFANKSDWRQSTLDKLLYVPLYVILFLWGTYNWPISYATSPEFAERSWLYRYWFIWPSFFTFRMRIYIGLVLSECVCTMAGMGAYPVVTKPKPGQGPSENFEKLRELSSIGVDVGKEEFDFETIHNINPYGADFVTTYREAMKNWNICIQYWLAVNVYKRFPSKKYRIAATMLVSSYWHGVYLGYYVCIGTAPLVLALEDIYYRLFLKNKGDLEGIKLKLYEWVHWLVRMHFFSYQGIAFNLLHVSLIFQYYNSIYHAGLVLGVILYLVGLQLLRARKSRDRLKTN